jgi:hypothetical protein
MLLVPTVPNPVMMMEGCLPEDMTSIWEELWGMVWGEEDKKQYKTG